MIYILCEIPQKLKNKNIRIGVKQKGEKKKSER